MKQIWIVLLCASTVVAQDAPSKFWDSPAHRQRVCGLWVSGNGYCQYVLFAQSAGLARAMGPNTKLRWRGGVDSRRAGWSDRDELLGI